MSKHRRLSIWPHRHSSVTVSRSGVDQKRLVYVILADKKIGYEEERSRIVYIGTTKKGLSRVASSAANLADEIFSIPGVRKFEVKIVTCQSRKGLKSWKKLERALILVFRATYGEVPWCNYQGKRMKETDEFDYFSYPRVERILTDLG